MFRALTFALPLVAALAATAPPAQALPVLRIDAPRAIPNEPKIGATLRMPGYHGGIGIETRGQSSQQFPKKSFAIELRDAGGKDRKAPLLGMPEDGDWVLYGPYNDKTLMRNVVAYRTARWMGRYAARTRFVRLRLDGRPHGVYVLTEKLELGDTRRTSSADTGERVQGEALFEFTFPFQARSKAPSFLTPVKRRPIVWEDPERDEISSARAMRLAARVRAAERALYGRGGWRRHLDEAAAVDFALVNELFKNQDGFHASTYMTLRGGKLHLGPVWDYDIAMGNSDYGPSSRLGGWMLARRDWAERLYADRRFTRRMATRWRELRREGLRGEVLATVARARAELQGAIAGNFRRWPVLGLRIWPNPVARGSHGAELRFLRGWLKRRIGWIDRNVGRL